MKQQSEQARDFVRVLQELEEKERDLPPLVAGAKTWIRHSSYAIKGRIWYPYVVAEDGPAESYRPFDHYPKILLDFIKLAQELERQNDEMWQRPSSRSANREHAQRQARTLLPFTKLYGLLGLFQKCRSRVFSNGPWESPMVLQYADSPLLIETGPGLVEFEEFSRRFFAGRVPAFREYEVARENPLLMRGYGEPVFMVASQISKVLHKFKVCSTYLESKERLDDLILEVPADKNSPALTVTWRDELERIWAWPVGVALSGKDGNLSLDYFFRSLLEAIEIMILINFSTSHRKVKRCKYCQDPFLASRKNHKYCCERHATRHRVARFREKR